MLKRRDFLKLSVIVAAGAAVPFSGLESAIAMNFTPLSEYTVKPIYRFHGHAKSGCAFRPELTDMWAGGGAVLPEKF
ncbi:MAG: twin-arginine translocation signal domain-containing protein [candidate division Zixibacteria bacterium]|nr:twin-arginine translocation signal domain-containing protein [candidate division Zixibacteria bacterium]